MHSFKLITFMIFIIHILICTGQESNNAVKSIEEIFTNLVSFTRYHASASEFEITYSKKYLPRVVARTGKFKFTRLFDLNVHIDEMCPDEREKCWCGIVNEPKNYTFVLSERKIVLLKMCSSDPIWMKTKKNEILPVNLLSFDRVKTPNGNPNESRAL